MKKSQKLVTKSGHTDPKSGHSVPAGRGRRVYRRWSQCHDDGAHVQGTTSRDHPQTVAEQGRENR